MELGRPLGIPAAGRQGSGKWKALTPKLRQRLVHSSHHASCLVSADVDSSLPACRYQQLTAATRQLTAALQQENGQAQ